MHLLKTLSALLIAYLRILKDNRFIVYSRKNYPIFINLKDDKFVPYVTGLFWFEPTHQIHIQFSNWRFVYAAERIHVKNRLPLVYVIFPHKNRYLYRVTDKEILKSKDGWKFISPEYFNWIKTRNQQITPLPFVKHHTQYRIERLTPTSQKRKIRIFFSGNSNKESYSSSIFSQIFGILNRVEIIETLKELSVTNNAISFKINRPSQIWILDWQWSPTHSHNMENRVPNHLWPAYLADSDFFLCCPGVNMPFCHNAIEAISMGCIPILQYNELFSPSLIHGKNCIVFTSKKDLLEKIDKITKMSDTEIARMRNEVLAYSQKHLNGLSIQNRLEDDGNKEFVFPVNSHSVNQYIREFQTTPILSYKQD